MSEYQRFISYLYEYQNNQKSKNCGFSRVEIRNQQCRLEVHMKLPPYPFLPKLRVFAFVHENDQLLGIPLGNANCHQGTVYGRYMLPLKNIGGFPYSFEDLGGLLICTDNNQIFGTAWKETVLNPSLFTLAEDDSQIQAASVKEIETPEKEKTVENPAPPDSSLSFWEEIQTTYPQVHPFFDDEIHQCVELSPQDIPDLAKKSFHIGSNQFLTRQYQTYHHFLLGKMQQGKPEEYVLAVPGIYEETEHFLAGMFGFPNFKPARSEIIRPGQFGYWYRIIY